jgi:hypothetical protein
VRGAFGWFEGTRSNGSGCTLRSTATPKKIDRSRSLCAWSGSLPVASSATHSDWSTVPATSSGGSSIALGSVGTADTV